jgi:hypothetical protein
VGHPPAGAPTTSSSAQVNPSQISVPEIKAQGRELENLTHLLTITGLSGGIVTSHADCSRGPKVSLSIAAGTKLDSALADATRAGSQSRWLVQDGVINVVPMSGIPELLNLRIGTFTWDKSASAKEVVAELHQLPEFSQKVSVLHLKPVTPEGGPGTLCIRGDCSQQSRSGPLLRAEKDITVLDLLNRIVGLHQATIWNYSEYRCNGEKQFELAIVAE